MKRLPPKKMQFATKIFISILIYLVVSSICLLTLIKASFSGGTPLERKVERKFINTWKRATVELEHIRDFTSSDEIVPILDEEILLAHRSRGEVIPQPRSVVEHEKQNTKISIIISHCSNPVGWVPQFIGTGYIISDVTIISKCGVEIQGLQSLHALTSEVDIIYEDNVGRCDHSYAYWIRENRHKISKDRSSTELALFLKDNDYLIPCSRTFDEVFQLSITTGFGCFLRPSHGELAETFYVPSMLHRKSRLDEFALSNYDRTGGEANPDFASQYRNLGEFREALGIEYPDSTLVPVCYGGMFMTRKGGLLRQTQSVWNNLVNILSRGNNVEEGHFTERLWATLASGETDFSMKLTSQILPKIQYEETLSGCFIGMVYTKMYESFPRQRGCIGS